MRLAEGITSSPKKVTFQGKLFSEAKPETTKNCRESGHGLSSIRKSGTGIEYPHESIDIDSSSQPQFRRGYTNGCSAEFSAHSSALMDEEENFERRGQAVLTATADGRSINAL